MHDNPSLTAESRPTHTVEDYLMSMHVMERDHGEIIAARLSEIMGVSAATIAVTFKRMQRDNWISISGRKSVHLTQTGKAAAYSITRRHMLTEWLLVKILKVPLPQIHDEAHGIEHAISPQLEERLKTLLENPQVCPHGNPFPGCENVTAPFIPLSNFSANDVVVIRRIHENIEDKKETLNYLIENEITPGKTALVLNVLPFNQTITIQIENKQITLGFSVASFIFVERS